MMNKLLLSLSVLLLYFSKVISQDYLSGYFSTFYPYFYNRLDDYRDKFIVPKKIDQNTMELSIYDGTLEKRYSYTPHPGYEAGINYQKKVNSKTGIITGVNIRTYSAKFNEITRPSDTDKLLYISNVNRLHPLEVFYIDTPYHIWYFEVENYHQFNNIILTIPLGINYKVNKLFEVSGSIGFGFILRQKQLSRINKITGIDIRSNLYIQAFSPLERQTLENKIDFMTINSNFNFKYFIIKNTSIFIGMNFEILDIFTNRIDVSTFQLNHPEKFFSSKNIGISAGLSYRFLIHN